MKTHHLIAVLITLLATSGCYLPMTGTVVDAESGAPIEGAVLLVEWTKTNVGGGADPYTISHKVAEAVSDRDGKVKMPGCFCPLANEPDVTVYKKGYVAWNNKFIFPDYKKRKDFRWGGDAFRMERFKDTYSYSDHESFVSRAINDTIGWENKRLFIKIYEEGERKSLRARIERT